LILLVIIFWLMGIALPSIGAEKIKLKFSTYIPPPPAWEAKEMFVDAFMEEVTKRSGGRVQWETFWSSTLGPPTDQFELCERGVVDVVMCSPAYEVGSFPLTTMGELPFSGPNNIEACKILQEMYKEGFLKKEWTRVHLIYFYSTDSWSALTRQKKIMKAEDLKGLKLRAKSIPHLRFLELFGATPVQIGAGEVYMALQTGVIEGTLFPQSLIPELKFHEVSKYNLDLEALVSQDAIYMNIDTWNRLPKDIQKIFNDMFDYSSEAANTIWQKYHKYFADNAKNKFGIEHSVIDSAEKAKMRAKCKVLWEEYIAAEEKRGHPAKAYANAWREKLIKRGYPTPF
jgi:TRAP-type C4-dicarboxylate transport system substrate-binding protein